MPKGWKRGDRLMTDTNVRVSKDMQCDETKKWNRRVSFHLDLVPWNRRFIRSDDCYAVSFDNPVALNRWVRWWFQTEFELSI